MTDNSMTTMKLKQINRNNIYNLVFKERRTCKLMITSKLNIGLTTVIQNLKQLEGDGLIRRNGFFESTGGRKADAVEVVANAKISIGVAIFKNIICIVGCNLYGDAIHQKSLTLQYENTPTFYTNLSSNINLFIEENNIDPAVILGVSIAVQGIVSADNTHVTYGKILDNLDMNVSSFTKHLTYKCRLEHDSKAAGELELWKHPQIKDGVVLLLNHNMGGAIITNSVLLNGENMRSGTIEHMPIIENGQQCYCGNYGCAETVCSVASLENTANMPIDDFFNEILNKNPVAIKQWQTYLDHLANIIKKLMVVIDGHFVISGYLAPYFTNCDTEYLTDKINTNSPFHLKPEQIIIDTHTSETVAKNQLGKYTSAIGTSLFYIKEFLSEV